MIRLVESFRKKRGGAFEREGEGINRFQFLKRVFLYGFGELEFNKLMVKNTKKYLLPKTLKLKVCSVIVLVVDILKICSY